MSIEFSPAFDRGTGDSPVSAQETKNGRGARATSSARRIAANRRNAQRSTGPRTLAGKKRASRNAIKHGLCSTRACLSSECPATYAIALREIEEELQPRTTLQRSLLPHIANLMWRIDRLPQAQAKLFQEELEKCADGEEIDAADVLARRFSDDPTRNGFLLMGRYERGLHNQLLRLMTRYEWLKKHRPTPPVDADEIRAARRRRDEEIDADIAARARESNAAREREEQEQADRAKRTQSNPTKNRTGEAESKKCAITPASPLTKRTQRVTVTRASRPCEQHQREQDAHVTPDISAQELTP